MAATSKAIRPSVTVETNGWLTRAQAMDLLGVSMNSIRRWEADGILHPQFATRDNLREVAVLDPSELCKVPRRHRTPIPNEAGELTARVFEMLDDGKSIREIVIQVRETVQKIGELREQWFDAGGADFVISKEARAEFERITGQPFRDVSELVQSIALLVPVPAPTK
jgi:hypothetical protein